MRYFLTVTSKEDAPVGCVWPDERNGKIVADMGDSVLFEQEDGREFRILKHRIKSIITDKKEKIK